jgi:hypothetical protein
MNGNITPEGLKLDLAWLQKAGIGGVHIFSGGLPEPTVVKEPAPFMSAAWRRMFREQAESASRSGMEVGIAGSPGWSETGGTWVTPQDGMKKYVWSEVEVMGGEPLAAPLPAPPKATGPFQGLAAKSEAVELKDPLYRDSLIFAFPTPAAEVQLPRASYLANGGPIDLSGLGQTLAQSLSLPLAADGSVDVEVRYPSAVTVSALSLGASAWLHIRVEAGTGQGGFRLLRAVDTSAGETIERPSPQQTIAFAPTTAQVFRVRLTPILKRGFPVGPPPSPTIYGAEARPEAITISAFAFHAGARVDRFEAKAGFQTTLGDGANETPVMPQGSEVPRAQVVDLSDKLRSDGRLDWRPPPGRWTIVRMGWSLTGQTNGPAEASATGLEVDKLDPSAVGRYIDAYLNQYQEAVGGPLRSAGVNTLLTDSWEAGFQNWTPALMTEFRKRRGYDPTPFLPSLVGRVVDSREASDAFLWDYRLTLKELMAENHYAVLRKKLHASGLTYYAEAQGDTPRAIGDGLAMKAQSDIPTAEYWYRPFATAPGQPSLKADLEEAASAAHLYGKPLVAAESLTVAAMDDPWGFSPRMLKPVADEIFARGVNRIIIHESHAQPLVDAKPGLEMLIFGQTFNRNETWAEEARPWVDYLARTSFLLQQGRFVADVAVFYGEERNLSEIYLKRYRRPVPEGHGFDFVDREALQTLFTVKDGALTTTSGMRYRVLLIPEDITRVSLPTLQKIRQLVADGAVVVGPKPAGGLGLKSPDAEVRALAEALWGSGRGAAGHAYGKGRVYGPASLQTALEVAGVKPDVEIAGRSPEGQILTLHRQGPGMDIYFLSNQSPYDERLAVTFRVKGRAPELWRAETGEHQPIGYRQHDGRTSTSIDLKADEAVFVVFRRLATAPSFAPVQTKAVELQTLSGPWNVSFEAGRGAPSQQTFDQLISWPDSPVPGVRYFSGHATYRKTFDLSAADLRGRGVKLDLGEVREIAAVKVNGKTLPTVWRPPYVVDVSKALRPGRNELAVTVVNLWPNRLIGDQQPGATTVAFAPQSPYRATSPLLPSGLLGPVKLLAVERRSQPPKRLEKH